MHQISKLLGLGVAMMCLSTTIMAAIIPAQPSYVKSLNGKWRFKLEKADVVNRALG